MSACSLLDKGAERLSVACHERILSLPFNRFTKNGDINEKAYGLMRKCWNKKPEERPSFADMKPQLEDLFLKSS